jgi:hypothetical protein
LWVTTADQPAEVHVRGQFLPLQKVKGSYSAVLNRARISSVGDAAEKAVFLVSALFGLGIIWFIYELLGVAGFIVLGAVFLGITLIKMVFVWLQ